MVSRTDAGTAADPAKPAVKATAATPSVKADTVKSDPAKTDPAKIDPTPQSVNDAGKPAAVGAVSYAKDVQPILSKQCYGCHNARKRKADLDLQSSFKSVMEGVSAGKPDQSDVYLSLLGKGRKQMPPKTRLPAADIEKVRAWIAAGALEN